MYERLLRPILFQLSPERAHELALHALTFLGHTPRIAQHMREWVEADRPQLHTRVFGIQFPNPLGLAAGLDKNAEAVVGLFSLGFGFVEVGTVTPKAQPGNPPPRLFRILEEQSLINRMGFNNAGAETMSEKIKAISFRPAPIGINIGKNKDTPLEQAVDDYLACAKQLSSLADYLVVNLSSPNTPGLRQLQSPQVLRTLVGQVRKSTLGRPLLLKVAPDLTNEDFDSVIDIALEQQLDGLICANTTVTRPFAHDLSTQEGGLSGRPLLQRATEMIRRAFQRTQGRLPLIGVGGVFDANDAWRLISNGASLVQVYTGFIYGGPMQPKHILDGLERHLKQLGMTSIQQAVGRDT